MSAEAPFRRLTFRSDSRISCYKNRAMLAEARNELSDLKRRVDALRGSL